MSSPTHQMPYSEIPGVPMPLSRLVLGTMVLSPEQPELAHALLDQFVAQGGNALDTAHVYGRGASELAVGEWMRQRGNRAEIVIVGKGAHPDESGPRVSPATIASDLEESLARLQTDYIDLYLLHRDDPARPVGELVDCLNGHLHEGRIRAYGVSNWSVERIAEANRYAHAHGLTPIAASSPNFSLAVMQEAPWAGCVSATGPDRAWYAAERMPLLAWSSQAQGFFTGRAAPDRLDDPELARSWYSADNFERLRRAEELGRRYGVSANTVALAYVLRQPFPTFALIGPRTLDELQSSLGVLALSVTDTEARWLNLEVEEPA